MGPVQCMMEPRCPANLVFDKSHKVMLVKVNWKVVEVFFNIPLHLFAVFPLVVICMILCFQEFADASLSAGGTSAQSVVIHCCVAQATSCLPSD